MQHFRKEVVHIARSALLAAGVFSLGVDVAAADGEAEHVHTAESLRLQGARLQGQIATVSIKDVSMMSHAPRGWRDFYCFTPKGSIHVLVPEELAEAFAARYADQDKDPQKLAALVEVSGAGDVYLRVRVATSITRVWTHADGRRLEADYLWANDNVVRLRRVSDGQEFSVRLNELSSADKIYVSERRRQP